MRILACLTCASLALGGMSGTYTIKPDSTGDFVTVYQASIALCDSGLSGDCVFEVYGDTLAADAILDAVAGSDSWTTTFRPGPGEHPLVADGIFEVGSTHNLKVEDLDLLAFGAALSGCRGFRVSGCRLTDVHVGIILSDCAFDSVIGNSFSTTVDGAHDVLCAEGGNDIVVANNLFSGAVDGSRSQGMVTISAVRAAGCWFNTFRFCPLDVEAGSALLFEDLRDGGAEVRNNLVILAPPADSFNACIGYLAPSPESLRADYNCYYVESLGWIGTTMDSGPVPQFLDWAEWQGLGFDPHGLNADPLVVGPFDLHLRQGSPCIGAGVPIRGITTDIDGDPRDPVHPCIGADEYRGGALAESRPLRSDRLPMPTIVRGVLLMPEAVGGGRLAVGAHLLDISGRKVMDLAPGANDVRQLAPGVYFVREEPRLKLQAQGVRKVIVTR